MMDRMLNLTRGGHMISFSNCNKHLFLAFAIVSMAVPACFAQIEFTEHTIADNFDFAMSVYAADIDDDGDMDVLGAGNRGGISWWENDGEREFIEHSIGGGSYSVYTADIDSDGDMDVLGGSGDNITWWENDGEQEFTEQRIEAVRARCVYAADIDGDGDMDVLGADRAITWWENDGAQDFTTHIIAGDFRRVTSVYTIDIDGDGDMDVLGSDYGANYITWWENDGEQEFTEQTIADDFPDLHYVYPVDVDDDGDMDVLYGGGRGFGWWENDGEQDFTEHAIEGTPGCPASVYAADIDGDGDMDVFGASERSYIVWCENDGDQDFNVHRIGVDFRNVTSIYAADIDGDNDMDLLGAGSSDIFWLESDLTRTVLKGFVFDFESDQPLTGAMVATSYGIEAISDEEGYWQVNQVIMAPFDLTARIIGYNDSTILDLEVEPDDTLEIVFELLHPTLTPSVERFSAELNQDERTDFDFSIGNDGNGPLEWSEKHRLVGESGVDRWELRRSINAGQIIDASGLQGVVFIDGLFYVTGDCNGIDSIHIFNREGELVNSFPQFGDSRVGMKDLAFDGELIWGVAEETVYGFNTAGDSITSFEGPFIRNAVIAWDSERELLWISGVITDIHGYNRLGGHDQEDEILRHGFHTYGLAYWSDDPDGYQLYVLHKTSNGRQLVHKKNYDTGDTLFVNELVPEGGGLPRGAFMTNEYDEYGSWVFMAVSDSEDGDRIDIWQLEEPNDDWMWIEPIEGILNPGEEQELVLTLDATGLDSTLEWQGELIFSKMVGGDDTVIPVTLTISIEDDVGNHPSELPETFCITSVYPNPFNSMTTIEYSLPKSGFAKLTLFDIYGRELESLLNEKQQVGQYQISINCCDLASGLYFVKLEGSGQSFTRKIMLVK
jgi:hypothetical protein